MTAARIFDCPPCGGALTLAGLSQHTPAWCCFDLDDLLSGHEVRGDSPLIETRPGRPLHQVLEDETEFQLAYVFVGAQDRAGVWQADPEEGLEANLAEFRSTVATGQVIAGSLVTPSGVQYAGECLVLPRLQLTTRPGWLARVVVRLRIGEPWVDVPVGS